MVTAGYKRPKLSLQKKLFIIAGITGPILSFLVFWLAMNFTGLFTAFQVAGSDGVKLGFDNFKFVIDELRNPMSTLRGGFKNTFIFFFFNLLVQIPVCYAMSFFMYKKILGHNVFRYIFFLPCIISAVVMTAFVKFMLAPGGPLPVVWGKLFGVEPLFLQDSRYAMPTLLVYGLWSGFGINLILYTASFNRIPQELVEAGKLDGLGLWQEVRYIVFPLTWPFFSTMLMLSFTGIFSASGPILLFTQGDYDTMTISFWIYQKTMTGAQTGLAAALGWLLTVISFPLVLLVRKLADKVEPIEY